MQLTLAAQLLRIRAESSLKKQRSRGTVPGKSQTVTHDATGAQCDADTFPRGRWEKAMHNVSNPLNAHARDNLLPSALAPGDPRRQAVPAQTLIPVPFVSEIRRVTHMNRKRRTVLWLYNEDYEYLNAVAEHDMDSKNVSMHRLVKALRAAGIKSFLRLEDGIKRLPPPGRS